MPTGGGVGSASLLAPTTTQRVIPHPAPAFNPDPRAVALADRLSLQRQVAQLFLVSLDGKSTAAIAQLGTLDWGGVVLDSSNFQSVSLLAAPRADQISHERRRGSRLESCARSTST